MAERSDGRRSAAGLALMVAALSLALTLLPACAARRPVMAETRPESGHGPKWVFPEEGTVWTQTDLLAVLSLPVSAATETLRIDLNGANRTQDFEEPLSFGKRWRIQGLPNEVPLPSDFEEADGPDGSLTGERSTWRTLAILHAGDLEPGANVLRAQFQDAQGDLHAVERRFAFRPSGRRLRCRVVRDGGAGQGEAAAARIVFVSADGLETPDFSQGQPADAIGLRDPKPRPWVLTRGGEATVFLPDGRFTAIATGGPLDSLDEWEVPQRGNAKHVFHIRREVRLAGTSTVDFHVHASPSRDSLVPLADRVRSFLAAGVDVIVSSDHGDITDYGPIIARLPGASGRIASIPGVETGSLVLSDRQQTRGHWNVWPLAPDLSAPVQSRGRTSRHGALPKRQSSPLGQEETIIPRMFEAYRRRAGDLLQRRGLDDHNADPVVIQLNHPRGIHFLPGTERPRRAHDWFNGVEFDPTQPIPLESAPDATNAKLVRATPAGTTGLDFDALEIWNRSSRRLYLEVRRDWFSLLNQGYLKTATTNTDTHTLSPEIAGYPLNIVFLPPGVAAGPRVDAADLARAVRAGRLIGTDGPVPMLTVQSVAGNGNPGDLVSATSGEVEASVEVLAAGWVPVGTIRVWVNGKVAGEESPAAAAGAAPRRATFHLHLERDAWIIAEVGDPEALADGTPLPGRYGQVAPRGLALGFTNPVFIDVDGNGRFDAPGLQNADLPDLPPE